MHAIIMAGGSGTRFWPLSRRLKPKQLLALFSDKTMLAETVERLAPLSSPEDTLIVTGAHLVEGVTDALPQLPEANIIAEPVGRNTAPCIGLACHLIRHRSGQRVDPLVGVFPADHHIEHPAAFRAAISAALEAASKPGVIVTLGIEPTRPETGYGYIRFAPSDELARDVVRFVEKPDRATAEGYLASGEYLWNAGIFFFRASTMLGEIDRQLPDMASKLKAIAAAFGTDDAPSALTTIFPTIEGVSIDYGVMEGAPSVKVVPVDAGWNDVGHWDALPELLDKDGAGCVVRGDVIAIDALNSVAYNARPDHVVAMVGVEDLIVVTTQDATLILPRSRAQDVRHIVAALKERGGDHL